MLSLLALGILAGAPAPASAEGIPIARFTCAAPGLTCSPCIVACVDPIGSVAIGVPVHFDGRVSSDDRSPPPGDPALLSFQWDFGDGRTALGAEVDHAFANADKYPVTLAVTDPDGMSDEKTLNIVVSRTAPSIASVASAGIVLGSGVLTDSATVSGRSNPLTATIGFHLYGPGDETCSAARVFASTGLPYPADGGPVSPEAYAPTRAGTYRWRAFYSGDANNLPVAGACGDPSETVVVARAVPSVASVASPDIVLGSGTLRDSATVTGRVSPLARATVDFRLYGPDDALCSGSPVYESLGVAYPARGGAVSSPAYTPSRAGTYRWIASYGGDANNERADGRCNDAGETVVVRGRLPAPPSATCAGKPATIVVTGGRRFVTGTPGRDVIVGGAGGETIDGRGGNDTICAGRGRDTIRGGAGDDRLLGEAGNDVLLGGAGNDDLRGGAGDDRTGGGNGRDRVDGGSGKDLLDEARLGGRGADRLFGGLDADRVRAIDRTADVIDCGFGRDRLEMDRRDRQTRCERIRRAR